MTPAVVASSAPAEPAANPRVGPVPAKAPVGRSPAVPAVRNRNQATVRGPAKAVGRPDVVPVIVVAAQPTVHAPRVTPVGSPRRSARPASPVASPAGSLGATVMTGAAVRPAGSLGATVMTGAVVRPVGSLGATVMTGAVVRPAGSLGATVMTGAVVRPVASLGATVMTGAVVRPVGSLGATVMTGAVVRPVASLGATVMTGAVVRPVASLGATVMTGAVVRPAGSLGATIAQTIAPGATGTTRPDAAVGRIRRAPRTGRVGNGAATAAGTIEPAATAEGATIVARAVSTNVPSGTHPTILSGLRRSSSSNSSPRYSRT